MRVLLVYHEPGVPGSEELVTHLIRPDGVEVTAAPLSRAPLLCEGYDAVVLLMFARGGHWLTLAKACGRVYTIPVHITASAISKAAGERHIILLHRAARRNKRLYDSDIALIASTLAVMHAKRVLVLDARMATPLGPKRCAIAPLALLPGRLVEHAERLASRLGCVNLGAFIKYGYTLLNEWIATLV